MPTFDVTRSQTEDILRVIDIASRESHPAAVGTATQGLEDMRNLVDLAIVSEFSTYEMKELFDLLLGRTHSLVSCIEILLSPEAISSGSIASNCLTLAFGCVEEVLDAKGALVQKEHIERVKKVALSSFRVLQRLAVHSTVQAQALRVLTLIAVRCRSLSAEELEVTGILELSLKVLSKPISTQSVKAGLFLLCGALSKEYPVACFSKSKNIMSAFLTGLDELTAKSQVVNTTAEGLMLGVSDYLFSFGTSWNDGDEGKKYLPKLYMFMKNSLLTTENTFRYQLPKAALVFLQNHAELLKEHLTDDCLSIFNILRFLCAHKNVDVHKKAYPSASACFQVIASELVNNKLRKDESNVSTLTEVLSRLKGMLDSTEKYELSFAITTYGLFARPIAIYVGRDLISALFDELFLKCDSLLSRGENEMEELTRHLPSFLSTFASLLLEIEVLSAEIESKLNSLLETTILLYPKPFNFPKLRSALIPALLKLLAACDSKPSHWSTGVFSRFLLSGMTASIGTSDMINGGFKQVSNDDEAEEEAGTSNLTSPETVELSGALYEEYAPLWNGLVTQGDGGILLSQWGFPWEVSLTASQVSMIIERIRTGFLRSFLEVISTFDLLVSEQAPTTQTTIPAARTLSPRAPREYSMYLNLVELFVKVSASYFAETHDHWMSFICRTLAEWSRLYPNVSGFYRMLGVAAMCARGRENCCRDAEFQSVLTQHYHFALEMIPQYTHEMLMSCVICLLEFPLGIGVNVAEFLTPISVAFDIGVEHEEAGVAALGALERLLEYQPSQTHQFILPSVIPKLEKYVTGFSSDREHQTVAEKLLQLLCREGASVGKLSSPAQPNEYPDSEQKLLLAVPIGGVEVKLRLAPLLPRVIALAKSCTDRKTRLAACEFLHGVVAWMIGSSSRRNAGFSSLWTPIIETSLALAVATDNVAETLFASLVAQLSRWFAVCTNDEDTSIFLDCLISGISNPTDTAVRVKCSELLTEYQRYAAQHMDGDRFVARVQGIYRRLISLFHNPSPWHRLGASTAFNGLCLQFKASVRLISDFGMDFLFHAFASLELCATDDGVQGTEEQLRIMIGSLERIIVYNSSLLLEHSVVRQHYASLEELAIGMFEAAGGITPSSRHLAMRLFTSFCCCLPGFDSDDGPLRWIRSRDTGFFQNMYKNAFSLGEPLKMLTTVPTIECFEEWLNELEASIECHTWLVRCHFITPEEPFGKNVDDAQVLKKRKADMFSSSPARIERTPGKSSLMEHLFVFFRHLDSALSLRMTIVESQNVWVDDEAPTEELSRQKLVSLCRRRLSVIEAFAALLSQLVKKNPLCVSAEGSPYPVLSKAFYGVLAKLAFSSECLFPAMKGDIEFFSSCRNSAYTMLETVCSTARGVTSLKREEDRLRDALREHLPFDLTNEEATVRNVCRSPGVTLEMCMTLRRLLIMSRGLVHEVLGVTAELKLGNKWLSVVVSEPCTRQLSSDPRLAATLRELFMLALELGVLPETLLDFSLGELLEHNESSNDNWKRTLWSDVMAYLANHAMVVRSIFASSVFKGNSNHVADILLYQLLSRDEQDINQEVLGAIALQWKNICSHLTLERRLELDGALVRFPCVRSAEIWKDLRDNIMEDILLAFGSANTVGITLFENHSFLSSRKAISCMLTSIDVVSMILTESSADNERFIQRLLASIERLLVEEIPLDIGELVSGTTQYDCYVDFVKGACKALEKWGSHIPSLAFALLPLLRMNHFSAEYVADSLRRHVEECDNEGHTFVAESSLSLLKGSLPLNVRTRVVSHIVLPCLRCMAPQRREEFFVTQVRALFEMVSGTNLSSVDLTESQLGQYTCSFVLLDAMYRFCTTDSLKGSLNAAFLGGARGIGKEMTEKIMRICLSAKNSSSVVSSNISPQQLLDYRQVAYSCLVSVLIATQRTEKLFSGFLLDEKDHALWKQVVDLEQVHAFEVETSFKSVLWEEAVSMMDWEMRCHSKLRKGNTSMASGNGVAALKEKFSQYVQGTNIAIETLPASSQVIPEFHRNTHTLARRIEVTQPSQYKQSIIASMEAEKASGNEIGRLEAEDSEWLSRGSKYRLSEEGNARRQVVEIDSVWRSSCCGAFLRLVTFLVEKFPNGGWSKILLGSLSSPEVPTNAKLVILRLITMCSTYFIQHAQSLFSPAVDVLLSLPCKGIHYVLRDFCNCLVEWKVNILATMENAANRLTSHLIKNISHERRFIISYNLEIVRRLLTLWKGSVHVVKTDLLGWLCYDDKKPRANIARLCGIQICGVLSAMDIPLYVSSKDALFVTEDVFYRKGLAPNLSNESREVMLACGQVIGLCLRVLRNISTTMDDRTKILTLEAHQQLNQLYQTRPERFVAALRRISQAYPQIVDEYLPSRIFSLFPQLPRTEHVSLFELASMRPEVANKTFPTVHGYIADDFKTMPDIMKVAVFRFLQKIVPHLNSDHLGSLFRVFLATFQDTVVQATVDCRVAFYELCIVLYDTSASSEKTDPDIPTVTLDILCQGLKDTSLFIRDMLLKFWDQETRMSTEGVTRFEELFSKLHAASSDSSWLQYSSILMLFLAYRSADFTSTTKLFPEPLGYCVYKKISVDPTLAATASTLTPMFSSSLQVPVSRMTFSETQYGMSQARRVPQQVNSLFTPTVEGTFATFDASIAPAVVETSLMFKTGDGVNEGTTELPRRRFVRAPTTVSTKRVIVHGSQRRSIARQKAELEKRIKKNRVIIFRDYRDGDFPDIQISLHSLIAPLQALCMYDVLVAGAVAANVGSTLLSTLVTSSVRTVVSSSAAHQTSVFAAPESAAQIEFGRATNTRNSIFNALRNMVSSPLQEKPIVTLIHELYLSVNPASQGVPNPLWPSPREIWLSATRTGTYSSATLLLEQLVADWPKDAPDHASVLMECWCFLFLCMSRNSDTDAAFGMAHRFLQKHTALHFRTAIDMQQKGNYLASIDSLRSCEGTITKGDPALAVVLQEQRAAMKKLLDWDSMVSTFDLSGVKERVTPSTGYDDELLQLAEAATRSNKTIPEEVIQQAMEYGVKRNRLFVEHALVSLRKGNLPTCQKVSRQGIAFLLGHLEGSSNSHLVLSQVYHLSTMLEACKLLSSHCTKAEAVEIFQKKVRPRWQHPGRIRSRDAHVWDDVMRVREAISLKLGEKVGRHNVSVNEIQLDASLFAAQCLSAEGASVAASKVFLKKALAYMQDQDQQKIFPIIAHTTVQRLLLTETGEEKDFVAVISSIEGKKAILPLGEYHTLRAEVTSAMTALKIRVGETPTAVLDSLKQSCEEVRLAREQLQGDDPSKSRDILEASIRVQQKVMNYLAVRDGAAYRSAGSRFVEDVVNGLLLYGTRIIQDAVPQVLSVCALPESVACRNVIAKNATMIPVHLLVPWTTQLLSGLLDTSLGPTLVPLLRRLMHYFPQVVFYPFQCTREELFSSEVASQNPSVYQLLTHFDASIGQYENLLQFSQSLHQLHEPELRLKHWITEIISAVKRQPPNFQVAQKIWESCVEDLTTPSEVASKFCIHFNKKVQGMRLDDGKEVKSKLDTLSEIARKTTVTGTEVLLSSYAPALGRMRLSASLGKMSVLTPVQPFKLYFNQGDEHHHIPVIVGFNPTLKVMSSMQRPKRLSVVCSNEQHLTFLVKGGDDLRLDQRIEQYFSLLNEQLHAADMSRYLVRTYSVVPISKKIGLVEWVGNTRTMKEMIERRMGCKINETAPYRDHLNYILNLPGGKKDLKYNFMGPLHGVSNARNEYSARVQRVLENIKPTLLRDSLVSLTSDMNTFYEYRKNFRDSLGSLSVASYLVGIGDRHLENFLIDTKNGHLVPIDFGYAFGFATTNLPIPELVPFRLTPQMCVTLGPCGVETLVLPMTHVLRVARENRASILSLMEVFQTEPLGLWEKSKVGAAKRLESLSKKMMMEHPAAVVMSELELNETVKKVGIERVATCVEGEPRKRNVHTPAHSEQHHIRRLIELATDPNVVGRAWIGWSPFW